MATAWQYTAEQLNYYRISYVVTDILTEGLRTIFKQEWDKRYKTTLGEWKDQPKNGMDFWNRESSRNRSKNAHLLTTMKNGNRAEWDCSMLFYAILYSDCIQSLNPTVQKNVDDLRKFRNEEFAHVPQGHLSSVKFKNDILKVHNAFHNLGLATARIKEIQNQRSFPTEELGEVLRKVDDLKQDVCEKENKLQAKEMKLLEKEMELQEKEGRRQVLEEQLYTEVSSFCILPSPPSHDVAPCTRQVAEIRRQLKALKGANENYLSILYISGNPGSGKSQLSRLVAKCFFDEDSNSTSSFVMTLNAENTGALLESYVSFARYCKCPEYAITNTLKSREMNTDEKITNLKTLISTKIELYTSWLLVVDNVTDASGIHSYLPDAGNKQWARGQMIITTQDTMTIPLTSSRIQHISASKGMDLEDARFLLKHLSGVTDSEMEEEVAQVLDYQPLAMASAATYVREVGQHRMASKFGWIDYLKKLDEGKRRSTENILAETNSTYPKSMTAAITLAVEKAMTSKKVIHHTFSLLSLCASQPILQDIVTYYILETDKEFDDKEMVGAKLRRCPLLLFTEEEGCIYIRVHRVVQEVINTVIKCYTKDEHLKVIHGAIASFSHASKIEKDLDPVFLGKNMVPHVTNLINETCPLFSEQGISEVAKSGILTVQDFTENFLTLGEMCIEHCELNTALKCCNVVLAFVNLGVVACNKAEAAAYSGLGRVHCDLGKLEQAKDYFSHALDIYLKTFRPDHVNVASSYNNLGMVCNKLGDLQQAKDYYQHAMDIQMKTLGPDHDDTATSYHNLGILHRDLGNLKQAKVFLKHSWLLRIKMLGDEHVEVASTYNELGLVYRDLGKLKKARCYYENALNIYLKKLRPDHVDVASTYNNLGDVEGAMGNFELANDYYAHAKDICSKKFGPEHDYVKMIQKNLAELQHRMERTQCCLPCL